MNAMEEKIQKIKYADNCAKLDQLIEIKPNKGGKIFDVNDDCKIKLKEVMKARKTMTFIKSKIKRRAQKLLFKKQSQSTMDNDNSLLAGLLV